MNPKRYFDKDTEGRPDGDLRSKLAEAMHGGDDEAPDLAGDTGETESDPIEDYFATADSDEDNLDLDDVEPQLADTASEPKKADEAEPGEDEETPSAEPKKAKAEEKVEPKKVDDEGTEEAPAEKKAGESEEAPQPQEPSKPEETSEEFAARVKEQRQEAENLLATRHYAFSDEEYDQFEENPREYLPKVAARVYMDAVANAVAHVTTLFPQMLEQTMQARDRNKGFEEQFFDAWPKLREHREDVVRAATVYRNNFPNAEPDVLIRDVGAQVMIARRIQPDAEPVTPQPKAQQAPHKPVAASPPASGKAPDPNWFAELAEEELADQN